GEIDMTALLESLEKQAIDLPVLIRFQDILKDRINLLCQSFKTAFEKYQYQSNYTAVYPIKVNQQFSVVSEIIKHGGNCVGLEAGSKPELMAVLSLAEVDKHVIICNGYKDREYIRLALIARRLGHKIYIVLEKNSELEIVLQEAQKINVEPMLGVRLKLASMGKGKWQNTGGEKAKFGLTAEQILKILKRLKDEGSMHWLQLLHFHMGSQIANLSDIKNGLAEAAQYYVELSRLGVKIETLDIGGGIGVDYEGRAAKTEFSVNYDLSDYADAVVETFSSVCKQYQLKQPDIITEAGRAMTAHHAVLITEVINAEQTKNIVLTKLADDSSACIKQAYALYEESQTTDPVQTFHKLNELYEATQLSFIKNNFTIEDRALLDKIVLACYQRLKNNLSHDNEEQQQLLNAINEKLADKLVCNFSVFQSVPDIWGISQIFPIVPLQRLDERPDRRAIIQDLTCDSDGQIEQYVDRYGIETSLPV
ncbi:MAG: arginine decarboxylase, partial [Gammaproteobacteria bacterium]|nr:arginine decarboxylase [Gammaproteobacteria bacterium]